MKKYQGIGLNKDQVETIYDEAERRMCAPREGDHFAEV